MARSRQHPSDMKYIYRVALVTRVSSRYKTLQTIGRNQRLTQFLLVMNRYANARLEASTLGLRYDPTYRRHGVNKEGRVSER